MSIQVTGTPAEILTRLESLKRVTQRRKEEGFRIYQEDEDWTYTPIYDERLCPVCESFGGEWNGVQVGIEFKDIKSVHPFRQLANDERYPNVHVTYPWLRGDCRCVLRLNDYLFTFNLRLLNEMEAVT